MKQIILILLFTGISLQFAICQMYNWSSTLDSAQHIVSVNVGWEYAAIAGVNYSYKLPTAKPIYLQTGISLPFGKQAVDDFRINLGASASLLKRKSYQSVWMLNALHKRYANPLVTINQIGLDIKTLNGLYKPRWFAALELGLETGISNHFTHSEIYRQTLYANVKDGWYKPFSASILNIGVQGGYSSNRSDLIFRIGYFLSTTSSVNTLIPYYTTLGYNLKIK